MELPSLPLVGAGFPSPAESFFEKRLDLLELLTPHPDFTYFVRAQGNSMVGAGIHNGDILVVDRALDATSNAIVVVVLNAGFLVKRIQFRDQNVLLIAEHHSTPLITVTERDEFSIWGVVTYSLHAVGARLTRGPVIPSQPQQTRKSLR